MNSWWRNWRSIALLILMFATGCGAPPSNEPTETAAESTPMVTTLRTRAMTLVSNITILVLAVFVGFEVITKVPPTLHTPLMSGTNAIAGITLVGALVATGSSLSSWGAALGFIAVILATINVVGGFVVTGRMLTMFQRRN